MTELIHAAYAEARRDIRDADLLLFRRRRWTAKLISVAGRSPYVHAAMAGWWRNRLMCVEMTYRGGRAQLLSNVVDRWPGIIDVYAANAVRRRFSRRRALQQMIELTGQHYGWLSLWRVALGHLPLCRFFVRPDMDDSRRTSGMPFCSQAVALADRAGGVDPVPNLADCLTEPGDLARSPFYSYRFTLFAHAQQEKPCEPLAETL